jgi:hypothetical protein
MQPIIININISESDVSIELPTASQANDEGFDNVNINISESDVLVEVLKAHQENDEGFDEFGNPIGAEIVDPGECDPETDCGCVPVETESECHPDNTDCDSSDCNCGEQDEDSQTEDPEKFESYEA